MFRCIDEGRALFLLLESFPHRFPPICFLQLVLFIRFFFDQSHRRWKYLGGTKLRLEKFVYDNISFLNPNNWTHSRVHFRMWHTWVIFRDVKLPILTQRSHRCNWKTMTWSETASLRYTVILMLSLDDHRPLGRTIRGYRSLITTWEQRRTCIPSIISTWRSK